MSVTITSNRALSILRFARSPLVTVSTLWPSRRRAISSSSQIERSSSQTRMLPTRSTSRGRPRSIGQFRSRRRAIGILRLGFLCPLHAPQAQHKIGALANFRPGPYLPLVGLHDLVHNGQAKPGTTFEIRLKGFEDLFGLLRLDARPGVGKIHLPVGAAFPKRYRQLSTLLLHRADCVLAKIPEHLLQLVAISQNPRFRFREAALHADTTVLGDQAVFDQRERRSEEHTFELQSL